MEDNHITIIKETLEELLRKMDFKADIEISSYESDEESMVCDISINGDDSSFLIGQHGANLQALQHLARLLVRKKTDDHVKFVLDVNSYRHQKNQSIIELARDAAQQAKSEKRAVVLRPMTPYERRIVHMELSKIEDVVTESTGEGESRKVIVKPASII